MIPSSRTAAVCHSTNVLPIIALIALNIGAGLSAGLLLLRSDILPRAVAMHGAMMIVAWGCLLPLGGIVARYFKVTPGQNFPAVVDNPFWWNWHRLLQYSGIGFASAALAVILRETGGRFDTFHGRCGLMLMTVAALQLVSPLFRGDKGGPTGSHARPDEPRTWRGDHYDMTLRRRLFEGWHKPVGWGLIALAQVTMLLGATLAGAPDALLCLLGVITAALAFAICDSHVRGRWIDTYAALWGPDEARRQTLRSIGDNEHQDQR